MVGGRRELVYQIYPPSTSIDTLVTGMGMIAMWHIFNFWGSRRIRPYQSYFSHGSGHVSFKYQSHPLSFTCQPFLSTFILSGSRRIPWPPSSWLIHKKAIVSSSQTLLNFVNILDIYSNKPPHDRNQTFPCMYNCICTSVSQVQYMCVNSRIIGCNFSKPSQMHATLESARHNDDGWSCSKGANIQ